jgi:hypothetical protein
MPLSETSPRGPAWCGLLLGGMPIEFRALGAADPVVSITLDDLAALSAGDPASYYDGLSISLSAESLAVRP